MFLALRKTTAVAIRSYLRRYKLVRQCAHLCRRIRRWHVIIPGYVRKLGLLPGLRAMGASTFARRDVYVKVPRTVHPLRIRPRTSDKYLFEQIFLEDDYDVQSKKSPRFIIDAGANVGFASVYFANRYPHAKIVAVEPEETNFRALQHNVAMYPNVTAIRVAIWGEAGELQIDDSGDSWSCSVAAPSSIKGPTVAAMTLDDLLTASCENSIDILKKTLKGLRRKYFRQRASSGSSRLS